MANAEKCPRCGVDEKKEDRYYLAFHFVCGTKTVPIGVLVEGKDCLRRQLAQRDAKLADAYTAINLAAPVMEWAAGVNCPCYPHVDWGLLNGVKDAKEG